MALLPEDKGDIKKHLGKALANKVSKVTNDSKMSKHGATFGDIGKAFSNKDLKTKRNPANQSKRKSYKGTSGFGFDKYGDSVIERY